MNIINKHTIRVFDPTTNLWSIWINTSRFNCTELQNHFRSRFKSVKKRYLFGLFEGEKLIKYLK